MRRLVLAYSIVGVVGQACGEGGPQPAGGVSFAQVSAGLDHACGVTTSGAAYCWGANGGGGLGDGTTTSPRTSPVLVLGGLRLIQVAAGSGQTCAVSTARAAYCWGYNGDGDLGDGTTIDRTSPVPVVGGLSFTQVTAAGDGYSCAVTTGHAAYCWGLNVSGNLGDGTTTQQTSPVLVLGGLSFSQVSAGDDYHACGVTTGGAAYCWGYNVEGQLGDGTTTRQTSPVPVTGGLSFVQLSAGDVRSCAVTTSGAAYCWGYNVNGWLGDGTTTTPRTSPVPVVGGVTFAQVSAASNYTCGLAAGGAAYCWGHNGDGQLGDGSTTDRTSPVPVVGGLTFTEVSATASSTCGLATGGAVYCWGYNGDGQLGDGTTNSSSVPVRVVVQ